MPHTDDDHVRLVLLEAQFMAAQKARVETLGRLTTELAGMTKDIRHIRETLAQARGGWYTLVAVCVFASAVSAAFTAWIVKVVVAAPFK